MFITSRNRFITSRNRFITSSNRFITSRNRCHFRLWRQLRQLISVMTWTCKPHDQAHEPSYDEPHARPHDRLLDQHHDGHHDPDPLTPLLSNCDDRAVSHSCNVFFVAHTVTKRLYTGIPLLPHLLLPYSPDDPPRSDRRGHQPQLLDPLSSPGDTRWLRASSHPGGQARVTRWVKKGDTRWPRTYNGDTKPPRGSN